MVNEEGSDQCVDGGSGGEARLFSRGTGFLLQAYGAVLLLVMACTCAGVAMFEGGAWQASGEVKVIDQSAASPAIEGAATENDGKENKRRQANMVLLLGSAVGAFCLIGFGVGMQADRGSWPALGATITGLVMTGAIGWSTQILYGLGASWWGVLFPVLLGVLSLCVFVMSFASYVEVLRDPPKMSGPPTVPGEVFPDPWAKSKSADSSYDEPIRKSIDAQRERLNRQMEELDELEERLGG